MNTEMTPEERAAEFKMPTVSIGDKVLWYDNGLPNAAPSILTVTRVYGRRIEGRFLSGARVVTCPHLQDPTLEINEHHREDGAWDFTDGYKNAILERNQMKQQIHTLQVAVADLQRKLDKKKSDAERMAKARAARGKSKPVAQEV